MNGQRIFGVTGWKNSGKTTLVCEIVREISARGFRVSTIKHAHKTFEIDHEGRDSYRHRVSGATEVAVSSQNRWALIHELRQEEEWPLPQLIAQMQPVDLIIIEGYKQENHPKIECRRSQSHSNDDIWRHDPSIVAIARDHPVASPLPDFDLNDIVSIASFILQHVGLPMEKTTEIAK